MWVVLAVAVAAQSLRIEVPLADLEARARQDSNDAAAQYNLALGYWSKKRYRDAVPVLERAVAIEPEFAPAYYALAMIPFATGDALRERVYLLGGGRELRVWTLVDSVWERHARLLRRAFMIDPLVDTRITTSIEWRGFQDRYARVRNGYDDGKFDEVMERSASIIRDAGEDTGPESHLDDALWYHALAAMRLNRNADAVTDLMRLVQISSRREAGDTLIRRPLRTNEYRHVLGVAYQRAGLPNDAIRTYQEALVADAGLYTAHVRLAAVYQEHSMWDRAIAERQAAVTANPEDASLLVDLGTTLAKAGRWTEAAKPLHEAMDANPRDARAPYYLGHVEEQLGDRAEARAAYTRFLAIAPSRLDRQIADAKQRLAALQ